MKKIIALLTLFFAFSLNAAAQDNRAQIETNAKKDLEALMSVIKVDDNMQKPFFSLFMKKHEGMSAPNTTEAKKREISAVIEAKLRASLNADQTASLEKNKVVFNQLIGAPVAAETQKRR